MAAIEQLAELQIVGNVWAVVCSAEGLLGGTAEGVAADLAALRSWAELGCRQGCRQWGLALAAWARARGPARSAAVRDGLLDAGAAAIDACGAGAGAMGRGGPPSSSSSSAPPSEPAPPRPPRFRVKCKRAGSARQRPIIIDGAPHQGDAAAGGGGCRGSGAREHGFTSNEAAALVGAVIHEHTGVRRPLRPFRRPY
jgi:hypothetical protein